MRSFRFFLLLLVFLFPWLCPAQTIAIKAGKMADPVTAKTLLNQVILVRDGKIAAIGSDIAIPAEAKVIDLSQATVMPGLTDAHTHLCSNLSKFADMLGVDYFDEVLLNPEGYRALRAAKYAREMLEAGFTNIREAGNSGKYVDVDLKRAINEGLTEGPFIVAAGRIIAPFGGQFRTRADKQFLTNNEYFFADTKEELRKAIRENIYYGSDVIKIVVDGQKYTYSLEDIRFIVEEARNAGLKVMAHCQTPKGEYNAAMAGVASIEHGWTLADSTAVLMKQKGVVLVSTDFTEKELLAMGWPEEKAKALHRKRVDRLKRAYEAGVTIAFGTDIMTDIAGSTRGAVAIDYITSFKEAGISAPDILKIMTSNASTLLGITKNRGTLTVGSYADIIAASENPMEQIDALRHIRFVMKEGKVIKNEP